MLEKAYVKKKVKKGAEKGGTLLKPKKPTQEEENAYTSYLKRKPVGKRPGGERPDLSTISQGNGGFFLFLEGGKL